MSTDYELKTKQGVELSILEHSNTFDVIMFEEGDDFFEDQDVDVSMKNLSLDELKAIAQKVVNVISYFDSDYIKCEVDY